MKNYQLLILFIFVNLNPIKADLLLGLHTKGDTLAVAYKQSIELFSISKVKTMKTIDLSKDTAVTNTIYRKACKHYNTAKTAQSELNIQIKNFDILNLTFHQNSLIIGISFSEKASSSPLRFGLIRLDSSLKFDGVCLFSNDANSYFRLLPYYPLEISNWHLLAPDYDSSKLKIMDFSLDFNTSIATRLRATNSNAYKGLSLKLDETKHCYESPYLYSLHSANYNYFFLYPYPILSVGNGQTFLNATVLNYQEKAPLPQVYGDGSYLFFNIQHKLEKNCYLGSAIWNDSFFYLHTNSDTNRIYIINYSNKYRQYSQKSFRINPRDKYFFIRNYFIYSVTYKKGKLDLIRYRIE